MLKVLWSLIWEQPQSALGAAMLLCLCLLRLVQRVERRDGRVFVLGRAAVSLGVFVFYHDGRESRWTFPGPNLREHEFGHTFQSRWFGPLYLLLVGVPSVGRGLYRLLYRELTGRRWRGYFDGWPEAQADRLGGVDRTKIKADWPAS